MGLSLHLNRLDEWEATRRLGPDVRRGVAETLAVSGAPRAGELSVTLLPDEEMLELARTYRGEDRATDVLAFDLGEGELLGDVYVGVETAGRNAAAHGVTVEEEVLRLVVHGVLHLLGHDHPEGEDRYDSPMFRLQEEVLGRLGR